MSARTSKPRRYRAPSDKRKYPKFEPGMSTATYVEKYVKLNANPPISAPLTDFFGQLPDAPAAMPAGEETFEFDDAA